MGSPEYERLCEEHYERVVGAAFLIVGDPHEALDVAQETFTRGLERWSKVAGMENPVGWFYRVATNLAISRRRWLKRRVLGTGRPDDPASYEPSDPSLVAALRKLTPSQRAVVALRFYCDMSVASTAEVLGKAPGTVTALTSQALGRLREELGTGWMEVRDGD